MSVLNFMFELGNDKDANDVNKRIDDKEDLDELKKLNRKEIVGSKLLVNTNTKSENEIIAAQKLQSDPLYLLKKEQIHQRNKILLNQYKMKKIKESISKKKRSKRKKKKKSKKKRDKKLKELLLKSLKKTHESDTESDDASSKRSRSRSRSREHQKRRKYEDHSHRRRHSHRSRRYRSRSRSKSRSKSPISKHRKSSKMTKKYGLVLNANKKCGVKMDKKAINDRKFERNDGSKRKYDRYRNEDIDEQELLRQMRENADEYDEHRRQKIRKYEKYQKKTEKEDCTEIGATSSKYLSEIGTKLYMNHSDTLQSRLNKNKNKLLKKNQL